MKRFFKSAGFILLYLAIYFIMQIVYLIGAMVVSTVSILVKNPEANQNVLINEAVGRMGDHILPSIIVAAIISFGIYYLICLGRKTSLFKVCSFSKLSLKGTVLMIPAAISMSMVISFILSKIYSMGIMEDAFNKHGDLMGGIMGNNTLLTLLAVGLIGPFIEEVIFRGLVYKELKGNLSVTAALIIQAVLFGLYHMQVIQSIYSVFIGLAFGIVYIWFKSIWAPIILHVVYNTNFVVLSRMTNDSIIDRYPLLVFVISIVILVASFIALYKERIIEEDTHEVVVQESEILEG